MVRCARTTVYSPRCYSSRPPSVLMEGWLLHFTNHLMDRRLRHYWVLEPNAIQMYNDGMHRRYRTVPLGEVLEMKW
jgi:hypothetical protein